MLIHAAFISIQQVPDAYDYYHFCAVRRRTPELTVRKFDRSGRIRDATDAYPSPVLLGHVLRRSVRRTTSLFPMPCRLPESERRLRSRHQAAGRPDACLKMEKTRLRAYESKPYILSLRTRKTPLDSFVKFWNKR